MWKKLHHAILIIILYISNLPATDCVRAGLSALIVRPYSIYRQQHSVADAIIHYPPLLSPLVVEALPTWNSATSYTTHTYIYIYVYLYRNCPCARRPIHFYFCCIIYMMFYFFAYFRIAPLCFAPRPLETRLWQLLLSSLNNATFMRERDVVGRDTLK